LNLNGRAVSAAVVNVNQRESSLPCVSRGLVYVTIALSGLCALGAEVVWTRLLALMFGGTTYTFSIILAVFLLGLGIGGGAGGLLARRLRAPGLALGTCQLLLVPSAAWAAFALARSLPYWPINPSLAKNISLMLQVDLLRCLYAVLPATCLWGASFPLALAALAAPGSDSGRSVGRLYAANTLGAMLGAVSAGVLLIPWLGTQQTQRLFIGLSAVGGLLAFVGHWVAHQAGNALARPAIWKIPTLRRAMLGVFVSAVAALLMWSVPPIPWPLLAYGRFLPTKTDFGMLLYEGEGMNASVAVTVLDTGVKNFHISGKTEASTDPQDMRLQRMLGHLPALFHPDPRSVLVVGCGAGVTAGSFLTHPGIQRISLCEIEPLIPQKIAGYFSQENYGVIQDPRVRLIYDDARHYILTSRDKFDVITSDPIHPWVKGAATLYTREYFELCKRHLNWGGLISQWVPLYESDLATVKSEIATFFDVFPEGTIWSNDESGVGYDLVLLGQVGPLEVDIETLQQRLRRADHRRVLQSLRDVGIRTAFSLVGTYGGQASDLAPWLKYAQINRDRDLRLQYLAGLGLNLNESGAIYAEMRSYRRFPEEIFPGSNVWNDIWRRTFVLSLPPSQRPIQESASPGNRAKPVAEAPAPVVPAILSNAVPPQLRRSNEVDQITE
jgi:spermidine synthase